MGYSSFVVFTLTYVLQCPFSYWKILKISNMTNEEGFFEDIKTHFSQLKKKN